MVTSDTNSDFIITAPGSGKTFVMLLAVNYALTVNNTYYNRCVIYSGEEIVVQQIAEKVKLFKAEDEIIVTSLWDPFRWRSTYPKALFVVDEAETLIATKLLDL